MFFASEQWKFGEAWKLWREKEREEKRKWRRVKDTEKVSWKKAYFRFL